MMPLPMTATVRDAAWRALRYISGPVDHATTFLLRMLLPTDVAMTWGFVIHLFLCGLFTFVFLRATGLRWWKLALASLTAHRRPVHHRRP